MAKAVDIATAPPAEVQIQRNWKLTWLRVKEQGFFFMLAVPAIILVLLFLIIPIVRMFGWSFGSYDTPYHLESWTSLDQYDRAISTEVYRILFRTTFIIAFLTTLGCVVIGYPVAYLLSNVSDKTRSILLPLVVVPFWTSILVRTFAWRIILGKEGFINSTLDWLHLQNFAGDVMQVMNKVDPSWLNMIDPPRVDGDPLNLVFNRVGTMIGMIHVMVPFMIFPMFAVMRGIPNELMKAAENLGAGPFTAFRRIYFPLSLPGLGAGALLVFIISIGFFITPALLGGPKDRMISNMIQIQIEEVNNWEFAASLGFILLAAVLVLYFIYAKFLSFDKLYGK